MLAGLDTPWPPPDQFTEGKPTTIRYDEGAEIGYHVPLELGALGTVSGREVEMLPHVFGWARRPWVTAAVGLFLVALFPGSVAADNPDSASATSGPRASQIAQ